MGPGRGDIRAEMERFHRKVSPFVQSATRSTARQSRPPTPPPSPSSPSPPPRRTPFEPSSSPPSSPSPSSQRIVLPRPCRALQSRASERRSPRGAAAQSGIHSAYPHAPARALCKMPRREQPGARRAAWEKSKVLKILAKSRKTSPLDTKSLTLTLLPTSCSCARFLPRPCP